MEAIAIPLASVILGGFALLWQVRAGITKEEREELDRLRKENLEQRSTIRELRDENVYLTRKAAGLPT